jgi:hypothetical protein
MHQAGDLAQGAGHGARMGDAPGQDVDQVLRLTYGRLEPVA